VLRASSNRPELYFVLQESDRSIKKGTADDPESGSARDCVMTQERMQAIADHVLEQIAIQYGATSTRDFRVIELVLSAVVNGPQRTGWDLVTHLDRQRAFSERTFGPGMRTAGVCDHIRKELTEIAAKPDDLGEWVDVILLALDGAWRAGHSSMAIAQGIHAKQERNEKRSWPDWRTAPTDQAIEHVRDDQAPAVPELMTPQQRIQYPPFSHGRIVCRGCSNVVAQCRCARHVEVVGYVDKCGKCPGASNGSQQP
jgi:hypothetical protein